MNILITRKEVLNQLKEVFRYKNVDTNTDPYRIIIDIITNNTNLKSSAVYDIMNSYIEKAYVGSDILKTFFKQFPVGHDVVQLRSKDDPIIKIITEPLMEIKDNDISMVSASKVKDKIIKKSKGKDESFNIFNTF